jgi:hypothetical protein
MYRIIGYLASLEVVGLFGFIFASRYQEGMVTRYLPLLFAFVAVAIVAYFKAKAFSYKEIAYISVAASAVFILVVQLVGFTVYPGLAKGMGFLSGENLVRTGVMLSVGTVGHFLLLSLARVGRM